MNNSPSFVVDHDPIATENPILDWALAYWRAKRGTWTIPSQSSFAAADLESHRDWLSFATALPEYQDFRYSFVGRHVAEYFGSNATGLTVREAYQLAGASRNSIDAVLWLFRNACVRRAPVRLTGSGGTWHGRYFGAYDALYLPLSDNGVVANAVMCCFTTLT
jgi:hypothetical protein